ncbi:MAG: exonuclease domain-containing protein [Candidatus Dormibacteria bacterium]
MTSWADGRLVAFDTETSGLDVETARVVSAYLGDGTAADRIWLADPGIAIPAEAMAIHGISTEEARAKGRPAAAVIGEITDVLAEMLGAGTAVVTYNAAFDFTLLDRECRRYGLGSLEDWIGRPVCPLVDPLVLDRYVDRFRPGRRTLAAACQVYGVPLLGAHDARSDALAALGVARALAGRYPSIAALTAESLHEIQVGAARDQAANLAAYLQRQGAAEREVDGSWPLKPFPGPAGHRLVRPSR